MFNSLQFGRAIAALLVVLHHATLDSTYFYGVSFNDFWIFGNVGVDYFFILSGFIIYWAHKNDSQGYRSSRMYLYKRLVRIYPPFILISLIMFFAYYYLPSLSQSDRTIGIVPSLFLLPQEYSSPALSVSWTLMHELLFYFMFLIFYFHRRALPYLACVWAVLILTYPLYGKSSYWGDFFLSMHNIQFLLGMLLSFFVFRNESLLLAITRNKRYPMFMLLLSFLATYWVVLNKEYLSDVLFAYYTLLLGVSFFTLIMSLLVVEKASMLGWLFNSKIILFVGAASYSIYLIHNPIISVLNRVAVNVFNFYPALNVDFVFLTISALSMVGGVFYYIFWERPVLRNINKKILPILAKNTKTSLSMNSSS